MVHNLELITFSRDLTSVHTRTPSHQAIRFDLHKEEFTSRIGHCISPYETIIMDTLPCPSSLVFTSLWTQGPIIATKGNSCQAS